MSEDIDMKIVSDAPITRPALRDLRDPITNALLEAGFEFDPDNPAHRESGNASRYTLYRLPYAPLPRGMGSLRPEIQIETAVWPLRRPALTLPVTSFMAEAFKRPPEVPAIPCVSIVETVAEKFVALTRRAGAEFADAGGPRDSTLVRHVYDLHVLRAHYDAGRGRVWRKRSCGRMLKLRPPIPGLPRVIPWPRHFGPSPECPSTRLPGPYASFLRDMVYGELQSFDQALATIADLAGRLPTVAG